MSALLEVERLCAELPGGARVVDEVSFSVFAGRSLGLVGESGCGKTSAALAVMRLLPDGAVTRGSVKLSGESLLEAPEARIDELRGSQLSMIFQEPATALNPVLTVGSQIAEGLTVHQRLKPRAAAARAVELLSSVGIADAEVKARAYPHQLSGGMRQRALIAAALACAPRLLIADEPTTALDVTVQAQILSLLTGLKRERGLGLLLITHDLGVVSAACDDVAVMYAGRIVEQGPVAEVFSSPRHPYTAALLKARPSLQSRGHPLEALLGQVPPLGSRLEGCRFRPRCSRALEVCAVKVPHVGEGARRYECHHPVGT
ncbi:MAG: ABC transporter ATP-binding protein [Archangiaceae bacterium]|nr:ABC transporter ATP-binding protein [Archangiaceae bacterium]